jgi:hypothetical protein
MTPEDLVIVAYLAILILAVFGTYVMIDGARAVYVTYRRAVDESAPPPISLQLLFFTLISLFVVFLGIDAYLVFAIIQRLL